MPAQYKHHRHDSRRSSSSSSSERRERYDRNHKKSKPQKWHKKSRSRSRDNRRYDDKPRHSGYFYNRDDRNQGRSYEPKRDEYERRKSSPERRPRQKSHQKKDVGKQFVYRPFNDNRKERAHIESRQNRWKSSESRSKSSSPERRKARRSPQFKRDDKRPQNSYNRSDRLPEKPQFQRNPLKVIKKDDEYPKPKLAVPQIIAPKVFSQEAYINPYKQDPRSAPEKIQVKVKEQQIPKQPLIIKKESSQTDLQNKNNLNQIPSAKFINPLSPLKRKDTSKVQQQKPQGHQKTKVSRFEMLLNQAKTNLTFSPPPVSFLALDAFRNMNKFEVETVDPRWSALLKTQLEKNSDLRSLLPEKDKDNNQKDTKAESPKLWSYLKEQRNQQEQQLKLRLEELRVHSSNMYEIERKYAMNQ